MKRWMVYLAALGTGLAIGTVLAVWMAMPRGPERYLHSGERAYARALNALLAADSALEQGDSEGSVRGADEALQYLDEARILADMLVDHVRQERARSKEPDMLQIERWRQLEGQALWVKARVRRDQWYAQTLKDGRRLAFTEDRDGERFLALWRVEDAAARKEAREHLLRASRLALDRAEIQREALRVVAQELPPDWRWVGTLATQVIRLARNPEELVKLTRADLIRAHYWLARQEFEQPIARTGEALEPPRPLPPEKRSRERMLRAREHLEELKTLENPPSWRALALKAQIAAWMVGYWRDQGKPESQKTESQSLDRLLFDAGGALQRARSESAQLAKLSYLDHEGVVVIHRLAVLHARDRWREAQTPAALEQLADTLRLTTEASRALLTPEASLPKWIVTAETLSELLVETQIPLSQAVQVWHQALHTTLELSESVYEKKAGSSEHYMRLALALVGEAERLRRTKERGSPEHWHPLCEQALRWIERGIELAQARKADREELASLHELAARVKTLLGQRLAELQPHLHVLEQSHAASVVATRRLLEGVAALREGKLEKAEQELEAAARVATGVTAMQAYTALARVQLELGRPEKALDSLERIELFQRGAEEAPLAEKLWLQTYLGSPAEIARLKVRAHLQAAQKSWLGIRRAQLGQARQTSEQHLRALAYHEERASKLLDNAEVLPADSPAAVSARLDWIRHLALTGRLERAYREVVGLRQRHPDELRAVLVQAGVLLQKNWEAARTIVWVPAPASMSGMGECAVQSAAQVIAWWHYCLTQADEPILTELRRRPQDGAVALLWAEWLVSTGRPARALEFLQTAADGAHKDRRERLRALALVQMGQRDQALAILQQLESPIAAEVWIRLVATPEERAQLYGTEAALETLGLEQVSHGLAALDRQDYSEAARLFFLALDYTRVRPAARQGLVLALCQLAVQDATLARDRAAQMLQSRTQEPALLFAYAWACLHCDQLGEPQRATSAIEDMASALDAYEWVTAQEDPATLAGPLAKAQFWALANRPDVVLAEAGRVLKLQPRQPTALRLAAQAAWDLRQMDLALDYAGRWQEAEPDNPEALATYAAYLAKKADLAQAERAYRTLFDRFPNYSPAYYAWILTLEKTGQEQQAHEWLATWKRQAPDEPLVLQTQIRRWARAGNWSNVEETAKEIGNLPDQNAKLSRALALMRGLIQAGAYHKAVQLAHDLARTVERPESLQALQAQALLQLLALEEGHPQRSAWAQQAYKVLVALYAKFPKNQAIGNNLAWLLLYELQRPEEALRVAQELLRNRHTQRTMPAFRVPAEVLDTYAASARAVTKLQEHKDELLMLQDVQHYLESALQRYPFDPRLRLHLADIYLTFLDDKRAQEALELAKALAERDELEVLEPWERKRLQQQAEAIAGAIEKRRSSAAERTSDDVARPVPQRPAR